MADVTYRELEPQDSFSVSGTVAVSSIATPVVVASITGDVPSSPVDSYEYRLARGAVSGRTFVHKFGRNTDVDTTSDPEDIWDAGGLYVFPTSAITMELVSSSASDAEAGVGAQQVTVYGLDTDWAEQSEVVTLNGTTAVALANSYRRINSAVVTRMGTDPSESNIGDLSVQATGAGQVYAEISATNSKTNMAVYTVPAAKTAYLDLLWGSVSPSTAADLQMHLRSRDTTGTNPISKIEVSFVMSETDPFSFKYKVPKVFAAQTDIFIRAFSTSADNADVIAGFNLVLEDDVV